MNVLDRANQVRWVSALLSASLLSFNIVEPLHGQQWLASESKPDGVHARPFNPITAEALSQRLIFGSTTRRVRSDPSSGLFPATPGFAVRQSIASHNDKGSKGNRFIVWSHGNADWVLLFADLLVIFIFLTPWSDIGDFVWVVMTSVNRLAAVGKVPLAFRPGPPQLSLNARNKLPRPADEELRDIVIQAKGDSRLAAKLLSGQWPGVTHVVVDRWLRDRTVRWWADSERRREEVLFELFVYQGYIAQSDVEGTRHGRPLMAEVRTGKWRETELARSMGIRVADLRIQARQILDTMKERTDKRVGPSVTAPSQTATFYRGLLLDIGPDRLSALLKAGQIRIADINVLLGLMKMGPSDASFDEYMDVDKRAAMQRLVRMRSTLFAATAARAYPPSPDPLFELFVRQGELDPEDWTVSEIAEKIYLQIKAGPFQAPVIAKRTGLTPEAIIPVAERFLGVMNDRMYAFDAQNRKNKPSRRDRISSGLLTLGLQGFKEASLTALEIGLLVDVLNGSPSSGAAVSTIRNERSMMYAKLGLKEGRNIDPDLITNIVSKASVIVKELNTSLGANLKQSTLQSLASAVVEAGPFGLARMNRKSIEFLHQILDRRLMGAEFRQAAKCTVSEYKAILWRIRSTLKGASLNRHSLPQAA